MSLSSRLARRAATAVLLTAASLPATASAASSFDTTLRSTCTTAGARSPVAPTMIDLHVAGGLKDSQFTGGFVPLDISAMDLRLDAQFGRPQIVMTDGKIRASLDDVTIGWNVWGEREQSVSPGDLGTKDYRVDLAPFFDVPQLAGKTIDLQTGNGPGSPEFSIKRFTVTVERSAGLSYPEPTAATVTCTPPAHVLAKATILFPGDPTPTPTPAPTPTPTPTLPTPTPTVTPDPTPDPTPEPTPTATPTATPSPTPTPVSGPVISSITPSSVPAYLGGIVRLRGSGFRGATSVRVAGGATLFFASSNTDIVVWAPPRKPGRYAVTVTTPKGTSAASSSTLLTYR